ncbi:expansin B2 [Prunus dulcis]|uniref:Expansin B2 n=1 Tax=Prunus dulcis TaxID=3755 RepID=A0A4Y1QZV4_PRUDU|nr:expansin B2 [Prunus dulcis]
MFIMALVLQPSLSMFTLVTLFSILLNLNPSSCFNPKLFSVSRLQSDSDWAAAGATWYGNPDGAGTDGGACGYGNAVETLHSLKWCLLEALLYSNQAKDVELVKCTTNAACSGNSATVVITDECPGCTSESVHFDLSGTAFGAMAVSGQEGQLRNAGVLQIQYKRVDCNYPGVTLIFRVDSGSNPNYFATLIEYEDGAGDLTEVHLKQSGGDSDSWLLMQESWGAVWKLDSGSALQAPFSIRLTASDGQALVANNVIPDGWQAGQTYRSLYDLEDFIDR